VILTVERS